MEKFKEVEILFNEKWIKNPTALKKEANELMPLVVNAVHKDPIPGLDIIAYTNAQLRKVEGGNNDEDAITVLKTLGLISAIGLFALAGVYFKHMYAPSQDPVQNSQNQESASSFSNKSLDSSYIKKNNETAAYIKKNNPIILNINVLETHSPNSKFEVLQNYDYFKLNDLVPDFEYLSLTQSKMRDKTKILNFENRDVYILLDRHGPLDPHYIESAIKILKSLNNTVVCTIYLYKIGKIRGEKREKIKEFMNSEYSRSAKMFWETPFIMIDQDEDEELP
jgi:hypothetical protein